MKIQTILATKGTNVYTVRADRTLKAAADVLTQHNIGAVVVVNEADKPIGILSERDIIRAIARGLDALAQPVKAAMTRKFIFGTPQDDLASVMHTMTEQRFRHLPVMEHGRVVGIVSIGDLVKAQLDEFEGELETLKTQFDEGD